MPADRAEILNRSRQLVQGGPPRSVRLKGFFEAKGLWGGIAFFVGLFLFFFLCMLNAIVVPIVASFFGQPVQAYVIDKQMGSSHGFSFPMMQMGYSINGADQSGDIDSFSQKVYDRLQPGDQVAIHYLPAFPGRPSLDDGHASYFFALALLLPFVFPWVVVWWLGKQKRLLTHGRLAPGWVDRMDAKTAYVKFQWEGKAYQIHETLEGYGAKYREGDEVLVLVNPEKPADCMVYDDNSCNWRLVSGLEDLVR